MDSSWSPQAQPVEMDGVAAWHERRQQWPRAMDQVTERDAPFLQLVLCKIGEGSENELNFVPFTVLTESLLPLYSEMHFELREAVYRLLNIIHLSASLPRL